MTKRKVGRPTRRGFETQRVTISMPKRLYRLVHLHIESEGVSLSGLIQQLLIDHLAQANRRTIRHAQVVSLAGIVQQIEAVEKKSAQTNRE